MAGWTLICGTFIAILLPGFRSEATDDTVILVSDWSVPGQVHSISMQNMNFSTIPIINISRPVAIDYDPEGHILYWTDVFLKQLRQTSLRDGTDKVLLQLSDSATPDGIAVDTTERMVFYTDAGDDFIGTVDLDTLQNRVLFDQYLNEPRAVITYSEKKQLYWTDWGASPRIETARYDGSDRRTLVETDLLWPNGITLDKPNGRLYWCDAKRKVIESVSLDGGSRKVLLSETKAHYFDIFHHRGLLYFTDWQKQRSILYIPTSGGNVSSLRSDGFSHLAGIHVTSNVSKSGSLVTSSTTAAVHVTTEELEENGSGKDDMGLATWVIQEEQATPALGESRTQQQSGIQLSFVQTTFVALGCVTVLLLVAVAFLVTFYLVRRKREQRQETYCYLDRQLGQGPFTNNMYMDIGATMDSNSEMYLVACDELKSCREDDPIYDEIGDAKKC